MPRRQKSRSGRSGESSKVTPRTRPYRRSGPWLAGSRRTHAPWPICAALAGKAEMATIEARITKVEHDVGTGWYSILTDHGEVKKLQTKMIAKAEEAAGLKGEVALIEYSAKDSQNTNPHTGKPYRNIYYERARTAPSGNGASGGIDTVGGETASGIEQAPERPLRKMDPSEAWRICLGTGAKLALMTLPMMPTEQRTFEVQKQIALAWAMWIFSTPLEGASAYDGGPGTNTSGRSPGAYSEPEPGGGHEQAPPPSDEDIPF